MGTNDLGDKKINNEQKVNEGFSGENLPKDYNPAAKKLQQETETDTDGNTKTVDRARHTEEPPEQDSRNWNENESLSRAVSPEKEAEQKVENKDFNSDSAKRYTGSHPDNYKNRGNIELDKD